MNTIWFYSGVFGIFLVLLCFYRRTGRPVKCTLFTVISGVGTLFLLRLLGDVLLVPLAITPFSLSVSAVLGIPGVIGMLIFQLL